MLVLFARKGRMETIFVEGRGFVPCTVLALLRNEVLRRRETETLVSLEIRKKLKKPQVKELESLGYLDKCTVRTVRDDHAKESNRNSILSSYSRVTVRSRSKGKGFQGTVKRHGYALQSKTHGNSYRERHVGGILGSIEGSPWKGSPMPGRQGGSNVTVTNLRLLKVSDTEVFLLGSVPGPRKGLVELECS